MLPLLINEQQIFTFQFWFNGSLRYGMYYRNDLYCKLETFEIAQRPQVYQLGCRLANKNAAIVMTITENTCSLWGSLRAPLIKKILLRPDPVNLRKLLLQLPSDKTEDVV